MGKLSDLFNPFGKVEKQQKKAAPKPKRKTAGPINWDKRIKEQEAAKKKAAAKKRTTKKTTAKPAAKKTTKRASTTRRRTK